MKLIICSIVSFLAGVGSVVGLVALVFLGDDSKKYWSDRNYRRLVEDEERRGGSSAA